MTEYKPARREVRCRILVASHWVEATFTVPEIRNFLEHLESLHEFEGVGDAWFMDSDHREPFFDVHRSALRLVIPPEAECVPQIPSPAGKDVDHQVFVLLEGGHLKGRLTMKKGVRVSDFFRSRSGFVTLQDCCFVPHDLSTEEGASEAYAHVVVNTACVLGVSEPRAPTD